MRDASCIPSTDRRFRDAANVALDAIGRAVGADRVERMLRQLLIDRYPRVDVHRQTELARVWDDEVWYVYRDGRPARGTSDDPD